MDKGTLFTLALFEGQRYFDSIDVINETHDLGLKEEGFVDSVATAVNGQLSLHVIDVQGIIRYIFTDPSREYLLTETQEMTNPIQIRKGEDITLLEEEYDFFKWIPVKEEIDYDYTSTRWFRGVKQLLKDNGYGEYDILNDSGRQLHGMRLKYNGDGAGANTDSVKAVILLIPNGGSYEEVILKFG